MYLGQPTDGDWCECKTHLGLLWLTLRTYWKEQRSNLKVETLTLFKTTYRMSSSACLLSRSQGLVNFTVYIAVTWTCREEGNDYTKCTFLCLLSEDLDSARRREPFLVRTLPLPLAWVFHESDNLPSSDLSCLLQIKPNVRTSKTNLNNTFLYGQTKRERRLTNFIYLFLVLGCEPRALAQPLPLSYTGSPHNSVHMLHCKHCLYTYKHGSVSTPPPGRFSMVYGQVLDPGSSGGKAWLGPLWFGYNTLIYCNYWESSFLLPLSRAAPVPDGRKARGAISVCCGLSSLPFGKGPGFSGRCV